MNNFFYTTNPLLKIELVKKGFVELPPAGFKNLFIDRQQKIFWTCNDEAIESNKSYILDKHKEEVQEITLENLEKWEL